MVDFIVNGKYIYGKSKEVWVFIGRAPNGVSIWWHGDEIRHVDCNEDGFKEYKEPKKIKGFLHVLYGRDVDHSMWPNGLTCSFSFRGHYMDNPSWKCLKTIPFETEVEQ